MKLNENRDSILRKILKHRELIVKVQRKFRFSQKSVFNYKKLLTQMYEKYFNLAVEKTVEIKIENLSLREEFIMNYKTDELKKWGIENYY